MASPGEDACLDVYKLDDGVKHVDMAKLSPCSSMHFHCYEWDVAESPIAECSRLVGPKLARPKLGELGLLSPSAPVAMLLVALREAGWIPSAHGSLPDHTEPRPGRFLKSRGYQRHDLQAFLFPSPR